MKPKRHGFPTDLQDLLSIYCYKLRNESHFKLKKMGSIVDRDHSTVIYHIERHNAMIRFDRKFREAAENFNEEAFAQKLLKYGIEPYQTLINNI